VAQTYDLGGKMVLILSLCFFKWRSTHTSWCKERANLLSTLALTLAKIIILTLTFTLNLNLLTKMNL